MPGFVMHASAQVSCFHQAPATLAPSVPRVLVSGSPVTTLKTPPVSGCLFQVPVPGGTKPQPCVTVQWAMVSTRVTAMGQPLLLQAPPGPGTGAGVCQSAEQFPQGAPLVRFVQTRVSAT